MIDVCLGANKQPVSPRKVIVKVRRSIRGCIVLYDTIRLEGKEINLL